MKLASYMVSAAILLGAKVASAQTAPPTDNGGWNGAQAPAPSATEQRLNESESKDSGRSLELVWARAEAGGTYINMTSFSQQNMDLKQDAAGGPNYSVAAGVRLVMLTLGVRAKLNQLSALNLWQVNGVAGVHIPAGDWDPNITVYGGYSFSGKLSADSLKTATAGEPTKDVTVTGFNAGVGIAVDYYIAKMISLGAGVNGEALFLKREKTPLPAEFSLLPQAQQDAIKASPYYQNSGSRVGYGISGGLRLGVHF